jgi:hypothetical protein
MIRIDGLGPHHNGDRGAREGFDADHLAKQLVAELQRQGHSVSLAVFHVLGSGDTDLLAKPELPTIGEHLATPVNEALQTTLGGPVPSETPAAEDTQPASDK